jgi:dsDNA-specific endonuclease/ATPase MutS2
VAPQDSDGDDDDDDDEAPYVNEEVVEVPITDALDLHTFAPRDVKALVTDYLELAVEKGFTEVRIIHGKGIGTIRTIVHKVLEKHPLVASFVLAGGERGGWGATMVRLKK